MGNHRFRLSDMIPNAWFYKLKDMGKSSSSATTNHNNKNSKKKHQIQNQSSSSSLSSSSHSSTTIISSSSLSSTHHRKSYYFTRDLNPPPPHHHILLETPRKSAKKRRSSARRSGGRAAGDGGSAATPKMKSSSVSAVCSCRASVESVWTKPDSTPENYPNSPLDSTTSSSSADDNHPLPPETFDEMLCFQASDKKTESKTEQKTESKTEQKTESKTEQKTESKTEQKTESKTEQKTESKTEQKTEQKTESKTKLPPIITKPKSNAEAKEQSNQPLEFIKKLDNRSLSVKTSKKPDNIVPKPREQRTCSVRRFSGNSPGLKLRTNSPRIGNRRTIQSGRRSSSSPSSTAARLPESFAVVKTSKDPQKDFRESMVEMIVENNIRGSKELENLLACYLSLNSNEYHDLIIKVFKQIWFDISNVRFK